MNAGKPGRIVEFGVSMTPSTRLKVMPPAERTERAAERLTAEELHRGTKGGLIIMKILTMSDEDKRAHVVTQIGDPLMMWWSFLTPEERRQFLQAAEQNLKETLMG
jgi:hypothetical protein